MLTLDTDVISYSGDSALDEQIRLWLRWDRNADTRRELETLIADAHWDVLKKRLLQRLTFGTAGLRGCMRLGFDSINDLVIVQTAQGLCEYIEQQFADDAAHDADWRQRGVVFGYDGRYNSRHFAELSAAVFTSRNIKVWLFGRMVITPFVPFAISQMSCLAGVMVTASHNPKEDNGYKVYWSNGAQIISPHDKAIQRCILQNLTPHDSSWRTEALAHCDLLADPYDRIATSYSEALLRQLPKHFLDINATSDLRFVYSAMHGVGYPFVEEAFRVARLKALLVVDEQQRPDPEFPTVKFPNPEEGKSSLELSIRKAEMEQATIILANDPDADRLACAEKDTVTGLWKIFNGNELGALLGWWRLQVFKAMHPDKDLSACYMLASTVSSKVLQSMGRIEGFHFVETLTGFKWMGNEAIKLMEDGKEVLFAFEEAIGFMCSTAVLDKDGVSAAYHLATLACYLKANAGSMTLTQKLNELYDKYGYHCSECSYLFCDDPLVIKRIFERLRHFRNGQRDTYPSAILDGECKIEAVRDLTTGVDTSQADGKAVLPCSASSEMITFTFANGLIVTLRTSGTEPKIKYYAELCAAPDEDEDRQQVRHRLKRMVAAVVEEFLQPTLNNLLPRTE